MVHAGGLVAALLILAVAASAQQTPAEYATARTDSRSPCVQLASRTHRAKRDVCTSSKDAKAANLKLLGLAPVNPTALAKTLQPPAAKPSPKTSATADSTVTEFQVASGTGQSHSGIALKNSKRPILKDVHGEAYRALAPGLDGGRAAGAAVGASSKGGKTHVFIETNHRRDSSSQ